MRSRDRLKSDSGAMFLQAEKLALMEMLDLKL